MIGYTFPRMHLSILRHLALMGSFLAGYACQSAPPPPPLGPLVQPDLTLRESLSPGGTLAGTGGAEPVDVHDFAPMLVDVTLYYLERYDPSSLTPLAVITDLVADLRGVLPVLPIATLAVEAAFERGTDADAWLAQALAPAAGRNAVLWSDTVVLPPGATFRLEASAPERVEDARDWLDEFEDRGPIERGVALWLNWRDDGPPQLALSVQDLDPDVEAARREALREDPQSLPGPPPLAEDEIVRRETLLLTDDGWRDGRCVLHLRAPWDSGEGRALVFELALRDDEVDMQALEAAVGSLAAALDEHSERTAPITMTGFEHLRRAQALSAFRERGGRRALLLLAEECHAPLTESMGLVADDALLAALEGEAFAQAASEQEAEALGWRLEAAAWTVVCRRALEGPLPGELEAALLRHAGAMGRFPDVLLDAVAASPDQAAFEARLRLEHGYALEDPDPSTRVRAHDWLFARNEAVPGYDPLAPREERRAALQAFESEGEKQ